MKQNLEHIQMVFLVSRSRSGSTLLQTILNAHNNICAPIESKFILHLKSKYENAINWEDNLINQFINDLFTNRKIRLFWNIKPEDVILTFNKYNINSFTDACKAIYLSFPSTKNSNNIQVIIDKNPAHARFISELHEVFPEAKFIHLIRDPRATIYSQIKAFNKKSIYNLAILWVNLNKNIVENINFLKINSHQIKYENLVSSPQQETVALMCFLDLSFNDDLLKSYKKIKPLTEKSNFYSLPHHHNTGNPINTKSIAKWKANLNESDVKIINFICYDFAKKNGYLLKQDDYPYLGFIKYKFSNIYVIFINHAIKTLFYLPFWVRKFIYSIISFFFDKKYIK